MPPSVDWGNHEFTNYFSPRRREKEEVARRFSILLFAPFSLEGKVADGVFTFMRSSPFYF
jgi:hypothetical protein